MVPNKNSVISGEVLPPGWKIKKYSLPTRPCVMRIESLLATMYEPWYDTWRKVSHVIIWFIFNGSLGWRYFRCCSAISAWIIHGNSLQAFARCDSNVLLQMLIPWRQCGGLCFLSWQSRRKFIVEKLGKRCWCFQNLWLSELDRQYECEH